ncbi:MAG: DUF2723 domain-containing protein [Candidatus Latescibacteria bacterium]|nr:DUF2723 domain-containing protein [Candidatus Latescibacterota bacterium]
MAMKFSRDPRVAGAWLVGGASLIIYTLTMAPTVAFWDVGEFISTAYTLGVPHPPGAPTFVLLGRLFCMVPTPFGVAAEVNFISVLASALTALLLYGIILEILRLWGDSGHESGGLSPMVHAVAAATGALAYAFSYSAWFNAVEAEVYGLSIMVTAFCIWLALRHLRGAGDSRRASLLLLIAYVLGVGAGNHLLALLTIPSILVLLWYFDRPVLKRVDLWIGVLVLFAVGYSLYALLLIRSGLNPVIDMNNPETWDAFMQFLKRRQYGAESMLLAMFERRAGWSYQIDYHFLRYFRSQFLIPFYVLALFGAMVNLWRDRRTFFANAALWVIMGFGLVVYLNMPDPQPRDRDYIFLGCYFATAIWIGVGMAGLAGFLGGWLHRGQEGASSVVTKRRMGLTVLTVMLLGLALVGIQTVRFYHSHDRTGDYISWDYGYNILQSCEEDAILLTNGDNDTYPLWYLQVVEGIRRDVRVANLSLLNTTWYIKELRDREPKVPILYSDRQIDQVQGLIKVPGDTTIQVAGIGWQLRRGQILRTQDRLIAHIINANQWRKPVYFAITVPIDNHAGFERNIMLEGFAFRVVPTPRMVNVERAVHNLKEVFQYRGINDKRIYKDRNASELLQNYSVVFRETANAMVQYGQAERAWELLEWGKERIDLTAPRYRAHRGRVALANGDTALAQQILEEVLDEIPLDRDRVAAYIRLTYSYAVSGKFDQAARVMEKWLLQQPGDQNARQWLEELREGRIAEGLQQIGSIFWR